MLLVSDTPVEYQQIFKDVTQKGEGDSSLPIYFSSTAFSDSVPSEINEPRFLYVMQEEYCIVNSKDSSIKCIGTSESTTCHMIILFFGETVLLAHTGIQDYNTLESMVSGFLADANTTGASKVDLYLVGGYDDNSGVSFDLLKFLLLYFAKHETRFNLKLLCCGVINSREHSFFHLPKVTGILVDIEAKKVLCSQINKDQRGPVPILRHIWLFSSFCLKEIYNSKNGCVVLPRFKITLPAQFKLLEVIDDEKALSIFSTSPEAESDFFITGLREMYGFVEDCIKKKIDPFKGKARLCFKTEADGKWIECDA